MRSWLRHTVLFKGDSLSSSSANRGKSYDVPRFLRKDMANHVILMQALHNYDDASGLRVIRGGDMQEAEDPKTGTPRVSGVQKKNARVSRLSLVRGLISVLT